MGWETHPTPPQEHQQEGNATMTCDEIATLGNVLNDYTINFLSCSTVKSCSLASLNAPPSLCLVPGREGGAFTTEPLSRLKKRSLCISDFPFQRSSAMAVLFRIIRQAGTVVEGTGKNYYFDLGQNYHI